MPPRFDMPNFWGNRGIIVEVKYHKCTSGSTNPYTSLNPILLLTPNIYLNKWMV